MPLSQAISLAEGARLPEQGCAVCASRKVCIIGTLPEARLRAIEPLVRLVSFKNHDLLQNEGEMSTHIQVVKLGTVMCSRRGPDHVQRPVALFGRGHVLGKYALLGHPNPLNATALSIGRLCQVRVSELVDGQHIDASFLGSLHGVMVRAFAGLADWSQVMRQRGLQRQLHAALLLLGKEQGQRVVHLPTQVALAALLSTTRESVARTLGQLEERQLVRRLARWHCEVAAVFPEAASGPTHKG